MIVTNATVQSREFAVEAEAEPPSTTTLIDEAIRINREQRCQLLEAVNALADQEETLLRMKATK